MLEVTGSRFRTCDGISRRHALQVGFLGLGGLSLSQLLALRAEGGVSGKASRRAVIFIELAGGPTHFETYDPKPSAPAEYRGPLGTTATNVPGVYLCEAMSQQAKIMDRLAVVRSITHDNSSHGTSAHLTQTGYYLRDNQNRNNEMPCAGSIIARTIGPRQAGIPAYVSIPRVMRYGGASYLGPGYNPFEVVGDPSATNFEVQNLTLNMELEADRLTSRRTLLASLDARRRIADEQGAAAAMDMFNRQAFEMITGDRARQAFDLGREKEKLRETYGMNAVGQGMLLARRLVQAGVTFVTVRSGGWDMHTKIASNINTVGAEYDRGVAALINDLHDRGLEQDVLVVAMGEFGRTPRINNNAGRDHWGSNMSVMLSGGGMPMGQAIGASNSKGEVPASDPYRPEHVLATVYHFLGIDPQQVFIDRAGRPRYVLEKRDLIQELVS